MKATALQISLPPLARRDVDFLKAFPLPITFQNQGSTDVMVESVAVTFQSNFKVAPAQVQYVHHCSGLVVPANKLDYQKIEVVPSLLCLPHTNCFSIQATIRHEKSGQFQINVQNPNHFLIINPAPCAFGKTFISFKDPQDQPLAERLANFATLAGFQPYIAPADTRPGTPIWQEKIVEAIRSSKFLLVIWTRNTPKGTGVVREIETARKLGIKDILLIANGLQRPAHYETSEDEYTRFDPSEPAAGFAKAITALRAMQTA